MSYKFLDHATDAIIEVTAKDLKEAFSVTADAVINLTLDQDKVEEKDQKEFSANAALPAETPVNIISDKTTLRSCLLFIAEIQVLCI